MSLNLKLVNNKRKSDSLLEDELIKESKRFVSIFCNIPLFTFIKESISNCEKYSKLTNNLNTNIQNSIGYFNLLPDEIFLKILKLFTIEQLSIFALTNTRIRNFIIENFLISSSGYLHLIRASQADLHSLTNQQFSILNLFSSIGLLLKRCTFLMPTQERIYLLIHLFENSYGIPTIKCFNYFDFHNFKFIFKCYGKIINKFISGWGDFECENVFKTLKEITQIDFHIEKFLKSSLGSKQKQELLIRNFFRMICSHSLDSFINFKEKLFWLINNLKIHSILEVSKLFIVIFGPLISINNSLQSLPYIAWWDLTDSNFIENGLEDLGLTIHFLYKNHKESIWSKEYIIELFETIITIPTTWAYVNISTLLYYCGQELTFNFLRKKLSDGNVYDAATYICYLNIITYKFSQDLTGVVKLIDLLIDEYDEELIEEICQAFSSIIYELDPLNDDDEREHLDISEVIESQIELMKLLLLKIINLKKYM